MSISSLMGKDLIPMRIRVQESQINADPRPNPLLYYQHESENSKNSQIQIRTKPERPRTLPFYSVTNGSGSGRPKNIRILRIRIRIPWQEAKKHSQIRIRKNQTLFSSVTLMSPPPGLSSWGLISPSSSKSTEKNISSPHSSMLLSLRLTTRLGTSFQFSLFLSRQKAFTELGMYHALLNKIVMREFASSSPTICWLLWRY